MAPLIGLLALLVGAIVFGGFWLLFGPTTDPEVVRDRMEAVRKAEQRGDISLDLQLVRDEMMSSVPLLNRLMMRSAWTTRLQNFITQAGMDTKPGKILLFCGVSGLSAYVIVSLFYGRFSLGFIAASVGAAIPLAVVGLRRSRRLKQFEHRFPEALDLLGRAVRAGHAFTAGLEMVSKEAPERWFQGYGILKYEPSPAAHFPLVELPGERFVSGERIACHAERLRQTRTCSS